MYNYIIQFIYAFFATVCFAFIYDAPKKNIPFNGLVGATGWIIYQYFIEADFSFLMSALIVSLVIGSLSAIFAIILKAPTISLYVPSLIPIVPGAGMYYSMYYLISGETKNFGMKALETILIALALAVGIYVSTQLILIINAKIKNKK